MMLKEITMDKQWYEEHYNKDEELAFDLVAKPRGQHSDLIRADNITMVPIAFPVIFVPEYVQLSRNFYGYLSVTEEERRRSDKLMRKKYT